jgi:hypothetical protein
VGALARLSDPRSDRQRRQLSFISEFTADIQYIAGNNNTVADTLSRPANAQHPLPTPPPTYAQVVAGAAATAPPSSAIVLSPLQQHAAELPEGCPAKEPEGLASAVTPAPLTPPPAPFVDLEQVAAAQDSCEDCQRGRASPALRELQMQLGDRQLLVDASSGVLRPLVPTVFCRTIFAAVHNIAHPGIRATRRLVSSCFMWPGLATDVAQWCKECTHCHRAKPSSRPATAVHPLPVPMTRFTEVHMDLVGPLPTRRCPPPIARRLSSLDGSAGLGYRRC